MKMTKSIRAFSFQGGELSGIILFDDSESFVRKCSQMTNDPDITTIMMLNGRLKKFMLDKRVLCFLVVFSHIC